MKALTGPTVAVEPSEVIEGRIVDDGKQEMGYDEACFSAALRQGLAPIALRLTLAGIPHQIEQTGGFCMVLYVPLQEAQTIGITQEHLDGWVVVLYDDLDLEDEGQVLSWKAPTERVLDLIREHGGPRPLEPTP